MSNALSSLSDDEEVNGVITEICVQNEQFIEYGQVLFRVRPA